MNAATAVDDSAQHDDGQYRPALGDDDGSYRGEGNAIGSAFGAAGFGGASGEIIYPIFLNNTRVITFFIPNCSTNFIFF